MADQDYLSTRLDKVLNAMRRDIDVWDLTLLGRVHGKLLWFLKLLEANMNKRAEEESDRDK